MRAREAVLVVVVACVAGLPGCTPRTAPAAEPDGRTTPPASVETTPTTGAGPETVVPTPAGAVTPPLQTTSVPAGTTGESATYRTYTNRRFGYTVDVPTSFVSTTPNPDSTTELVLTSPDGQVSLTATALNNTERYPVTTFYRSATDGIAADGASLTYQDVSTDAFTVSGTTTDGRVFYRVSRLLGSDGAALATVRWTYPASRVRDLDPAVTRSADTFRPSPVR